MKLIFSAKIQQNLIYIFLGISALSILLFPTISHLLKEEFESNSKFAKIIYDDLTSSEPGNITRRHQNSISKNPKRILLWTSFFGDYGGWSYFLSSGNSDFSTCESEISRNCEVTSDRNLISSSEAVLFHSRDLDFLDLPNHFQRSLDQVWIFYSLESPPYSTFPGFRFMHNMFNWTLSYREDSDVMIRYGRFVRRKKAKLKEVFEKFGNLLHVKVEGGTGQENFDQKYGKIHPTDSVLDNLQSELNQRQNFLQEFHDKNDSVVTNPQNKFNKRQLRTVATDSGKSEGSVLLNNDLKTFLKTDENLMEGDSEVSSANFKTELKKIWSQKFRKIVWISSHCKTSSAREDFVKILQEYMDIDVVGSCGNVKCSNSEKQNCVEKFSKTHFFYLSMENSICKDYVTEKFYNALRHNIVPVVFGGANYSAIAPPNSFINALDFDGPKSLAQFLAHVAKNETLYSSYLEWKWDYEIVEDDFKCRLCQKLNENRNQKQAYGDMMSWWVQGSLCKTWKHGAPFEYAPIIGAV